MFNSNWISLTHSLRHIIRVSRGMWLMVGGGAAMMILMRLKLMPMPG